MNRPIAVVTGDLTEAATLDSLGGVVQHHEKHIEVLVSNARAYPRIPWDRLDLGTFR